MGLDPPLAPQGILCIPRRNDHKAFAIGDALACFTSMRKVNFGSNPNVTAAGWKALLSNLYPTVEEFDLEWCGLDDDADVVAILMNFDCPLA